MNETKIEIEPKKVKGSKRLLALDILMIIVFIVCIIIAGYTYFHNQEYTTGASVVFTDSSGTPQWYGAFDFTSDVFSAQNEITVSVIIHPTPNTTQYPASTLYLYFPYSSPPKPEYDQYGNELSQVLELHEGSDNVYANSTTLLYETEGTQCADLSNGQLQSVTCGPSSVAIIKVSSSDTVFQYQSSKVSLSLTWVVLAFTILFIRDFVISSTTNATMVRRAKKEVSQPTTMWTSATTNR